MTLREPRGQPSILSARGKRNDSFGDGDHVSQFVRKAGFYLTTRTPSIVQRELSPGYLDCLLEFGELEFPLDFIHCNY